MNRLEVKQLDCDLTPVAGLALVGYLPLALRPQWSALNCAQPMRSGVSNADVLRRYLSLLAQGNSDLDAIENCRSDTYFKGSSGIVPLPASLPLRQRFDAQVSASFEHVPGTIEALLRDQRPDYGLLPCCWLPLAA